MRRLPDWEMRLGAYLDPLWNRPFQWGRHDCCTFSAGAVEAMTGLDPMPEFRGRYSTAIGSARSLRRFGAGDLPTTMDLKFKGAPASLAQRGDIVMTGGLLGVCLGGFLLAVGQEDGREGLVRIDRTHWMDARAWRVPVED